MSNEELNNAIARADAELDMLKDSCHDLYDRNKELQQRIDKAIEYIESYLPNYDFDKTNLGELLDILKGSEENDK